MVGITTVSPHAVDESAPCLHVRSASATSQRGCRRYSAQGFFEPLRTMCRAATRVASSCYTRYRAVTRGTELLGLEVAQKRYSSGLPPALQVGDKIIFRPRMFGRIFAISLGVRAHFAPAPCAFTRRGARRAKKKSARNALLHVYL